MDTNIKVNGKWRIFNDYMEPLRDAAELIHTDRLYCDKFLMSHFDGNLVVAVDRTRTAHQDTIFMYFKGDGVVEIKSVDVMGEEIIRETYDTHCYLDKRFKTQQQQFDFFLQEKFEFKY